MPHRDPCRRCLRDLCAAGFAVLAASAVGGIAVAWWLLRSLPDFSGLSAGQ